ncbi:macrolide transport system ATP-binding/permease protein [Aneurinibacillus soli]|uniref:Ribosome protection protein VmlR n=1 Tax=Aneurinibacillus soli TaxID=1500254 RepID=A0A0U4WIR2_9BACL|nr:ABC-F type ribosomal protection protein [Aneurinibacillus soli]PYE61651.1 macrolide transport system ATP-binding/permease protein [Aneurinibacillus soli]BAU28491.1 putative ABC transporter ATP-binding protein YheS [Aneurinibacillus soli]
MKEILKLSNISYEVMDFTIFEDVHASVQQGDIIGVIGKNGAGKSTLLQLLNNDVVPSQGQIQWLQQGLEIFMVEQETESYFFEDKTPFEVKLLEKWHVPTHDFLQLSGGEKLKARLAKGFSKDADLLLLDEPTNHLDAQSLEFLTKQIKNYKGTIILVSHDRYFLDTVATKIWSIEGKKLIEHKGNYSSYMEFRKQKRLTQQREYEKQQKMIERIEDQMNELTSWSKKAHAQSTKQEFPKEYYRVKAKRMDAQVKSKQKRLEKELEKAKAEPVETEYTVHFSMKAKHKVGKRFLEVKNVTKSFAGRTLFKNVNFTIQHGEKVAIIGPNGSGKTTLLKVIVGQETAKGDVWISPSAKIGYLTQEVFDLPLEQTPEQLFYKKTFEARGKVQTLMKHLGFMTSHWTEPIRNMSMGERVKCKLMEHIVEGKDVLILDEPTNHLDLPSREQLEDTLAQYNGTLIVVSHDRYFLEKTTNSKLVISNHSIQKQLNELSPKRANLDELRLILETERQEVLGKLSFMTPNDKAYTELDKKFKELTKQINELS